MRIGSCHSIAALFAVGAMLTFADTGARAAVPTVDGPSVGRMHRVIIVDRATPAVAAKPSAPVNRSLNDQGQDRPQTRPGPRSAQAPAPSAADDTVPQGTRAASAR